MRTMIPNISFYKIEDDHCIQKHCYSTFVITLLYLTHYKLVFYQMCKDDIPMYDDSGGSSLVAAAAGSHGAVFCIITETYWNSFAVQ